MKNKRWIGLAAVILLAALRAGAQEAVIAPAENLVVDGVPEIPSKLAEKPDVTALSNGDVADWHPQREEMLITTRFAETAATASGENAGRRTAAAHLFCRLRCAMRGFIRTAATTWFS